MEVIDWLLDSDPSIRWQVMRDLTNQPDEVVAAERSKVAAEGWGARFLSLQGGKGQWGRTSSRPRASYQEMLSPMPQPASSSVASPNPCRRTRRLSQDRRFAALRLGGE